jgi:tetratricopeptide (TPR) repeat protein
LYKHNLLILILGILIFAGLSGCKRKASSDETTAAPESSQTLINQSMALYAQRDDLSKLRAAINTLKEARTRDFSNYEILWRLAEYNYYLGSHTTNDEERGRAFREGIDAGKAAIQAKPDAAEGHFWLGANYGGTAKTGVLAGLSSIDDIRNEMQAVLRIDPSYEGGSAYMILGQVSLEAPKMLGGDPAAAVEYLQKGDRLDNANPMLKLQLAEAYFKTDRIPDAKKKLDEIDKIPPDPDYLPENREVLEGVKDLRKRIEEKTR